MPLTRRRFLGTQGAIAASAALGGLIPARVLAEDTLSLGDMTLTTVSDGSLTLPADMIFAPMPEADLADIITRHGLAGDVLTPPCNVTLLRDGARVILFDVGAGPHFMPTAGKLPDALDALGIAPDDVTDVLFTHGHPDHIWGLLDDFDDPLFANASYRMGRDEWAYWMDPDTVDSIGSDRTAMAVGAQRRLERIADIVTLFDDGEEILPGIAARATYGHTPGHMAFEVRSGNQAAMIVGDSIGNDHVAFERPDWPSGSDHDQPLAAQTRVNLLDQLAHDQIPTIGFHLSDGGIGRVERQDSGYQFVAEI